MADKSQAETQYAEFVMKSSADKAERDALMEDIVENPKVVDAVGDLRKTRKGKREAKRYSELQEAEIRFEESVKNLIDAAQASVDLYTQQSSEAQATCKGGPRVAKRWRWFGRDIIKCSAPMLSNIYWEIPGNKPNSIFKRKNS